MSGSKKISAEETRDTLKAFSRVEKEKEEWHNETIHFEVQDENGNAVHRFRLARRRCQAEEIQRIVQAYPEGLTMNYLMEKTSSEILYPSDVISKCRGKPCRYVIVPRKERDIYDAAMCDDYEGTLALLIENVPVWDDHNENRVSANDLREWIMFGLQEEDNRVKKAVAYVGAVQDEIEALVQDLANVPFMLILDAKGKPRPEDEADEERQIRYQELTSDKEGMERRLEAAKRHAQKVVAARDRTRLVLTPLGMENSRLGPRTESWFCTFRSAEADRLEFWAANKTDWDGVKLALGHTIYNEDQMPIYQPPWAGRGSVPNGSKQFLPDYSGHVVNMQAVVFKRVQHGFGIRLDRDTNAYYHGQFRAGLEHGKGVQYSETGIYVGPLKEGNRCGEARLDYANGDCYTGSFGTSDLSNLLPLSQISNRYAQGVPHGSGKMLFADGSSYEGEFREGRICGFGKYRGASSEMAQGNFKDGVLEGENGEFHDVAGESYKGTFRYGDYHGYGVRIDPAGTKYEGIFKLGHREGRAAFETQPDGAEYQGDFFFNDRHGHGALRYGRHDKDTKVSTTWTDRSHLFKAKYEGRWLCGKIRTKGCHINKSLAYYTMNNEQRYPYLTAILKRNEAHRSTRDAKARSHSTKLDRDVRAEIIRKKCKIFRQQRHHTRNILKHRHLVNHEDTDAHIALRQRRLDDLLMKNKLSLHQAKRIINETPFTDAILEVNDQVATTSISATAVTEADIADNPLSALVQSEAEELQERWQALDLARSVDLAHQRLLWQNHNAKLRDPSLL